MLPTIHFPYPTSYSFPCPKTGVSALGSVFRTTIDSEGMAVVEAAVKAGINWFDAAPWYGHGKGETVFGRVRTVFV